MPGITFDDGRNDWLVARWAACGFLELLRERVPGDLRDTVQGGIDMDALQLGLLDITARVIIEEAIALLAQEVIEGKHPVSVEGRMLDPASQDEYRDAVRELLGIIRREVGNQSSG